MEQLSNKNPRIEVVDALRGFAVMAILLVHSLEHFIFPVYPTDSPTWLNILDQGVLSGTLPYLPENLTQSSHSCSDLHFTFRAIIRRSKARTSAIVSYGV